MMLNTPQPPTYRALMAYEVDNNGLVAGNGQQPAKMDTAMAWPARQIGMAQASKGVRTTAALSGGISKRTQPATA